MGPWEKWVYKDKSSFQVQMAKASDRRILQETEVEAAKQRTSEKDEGANRKEKLKNIRVGIGKYGEIYILPYNN